MKCNDNYTAKMILRKSGNYMRLSLIIFITMISLVSFSILFYLSYSEDNTKNYSANEIVHVLSVNGKFEDNTYRELKATDKQNIVNLIKKEKINATAEFFYSFTGALINDEKMVLIIGVDKNSEHYIVDGKMEDDVLYTDDFDSDKLIINIPCMKIDEEGNVSSDSLVNKEYRRKNAIKNKVINYFSHGFEELKKVYVTEKSYKDIVHIAREKDINKNDVIEESLIDAAYVNVEDLNDVDGIAKKMEDEGYDIEYTFSAFDAMGASIQKNGIMFFMMIIFLLIVASINLGLSLMSYIDMSRKDMGVLKFLGYNDNRIFKIYSRNINRIFLALAVVAEVCIVTLTFATIENNGVSVIIAMTIGMIGLLIILNILVNVFYLKNVIKKNLLFLIKETKQFE